MIRHLTALLLDHPVVGMFIASLLACSDVSAREFQNLGFESANTNNVSPQGEGLSADLTPGWQWNVGTRGYTANAFMYVNQSIDMGNGLGWASLVTVVNPYDFPVVGKYGVWLAPGYAGSILPTSVRQSGMIPRGTKSLQFLDYYAYGSGEPPTVLGEVRINGSLMPLYNSLISIEPTPGPPGWSTFAFESGVDVSAYAGQEVTLEFSISNRGMGLDDIQFSPFAVVPEPATWALLGLGLAGWLWARARH